jgi:hypothetical protein
VLLRRGSEEAKTGRLRLGRFAHIASLEKNVALLLLLLLLLLLVVVVVVLPF